MGEIEEGWHTLDDGAKVYTKVWKTTGSPKARLIFIHGFNEHCNTFGNMFPMLASKGIEVFGFDQRGWGNSAKTPKERGLTGPTSTVLTDIASVVKRFVPITSDNPTTSVPLFLMGHSMGGAETIHFASVASRSPPGHYSLSPEATSQIVALDKHITGYLIYSPFIAWGNGLKPSWIAVSAGRLVSSMFPHLQIKQQPPPKLLSRNQGEVQMFLDDPLVRDMVTMEGLGEMVGRLEACDKPGEIVISDEGKERRVWLGHGTDDGLCNFEGTKAWFDRDCKVKDKQLASYPKGFHRLHAEPDGMGEKFVGDAADWILARA